LRDWRRTFAGLEEDIAAWAEHGDRLGIELARLEAMVDGKAPVATEALRRKIAAMVRDRDEIVALLPEAHRDLEKAREVLGK
jgi:hypothetical protein